MLLFKKSELQIYRSSFYPKKYQEVERNGKIAGYAAIFIDIIFFEEISLIKSKQEKKI